MIEVQEIFREYGEEYRRNHKMQNHIIKAIGTSRKVVPFFLWIIVLNRIFQIQKSCPWDSL